MPAAADRVSMEIGTWLPATTRVGLTLHTNQGTRAAHALAPSKTGEVVFDVSPLGKSSPAVVCLRPAGHLGDVRGTFADPFLGVNYAPRPLPSRGPPQADIGGRRLTGLVAVRFLAAGAPTRAKRLGSAAQRAARFRPGFVGAWTYVALLFVIPLLWGAGLWLLSGRSRWRVRSVVVVVSIAFVNASAWALVTPAFEGPDEEAHIAYAQQLAETGHRPRPDPRVPYASSELQLALEDTHHYSVFRSPTLTRPPWEAHDEQNYAQEVAARHPARDDGGGATGASNYGPIYYALSGGGYRVSGGSLFNRIFFMRLVSALLAALAVGFVFASARELLPGRRWPPIAAALLVAFQPMFGFISGTVNPDAAANLAGAALLYLAIRAMRRGFTGRVAAALAVVFVVGVLAKTTVVTLAPAIALGVIVSVRRRRVAMRVWAALVGALAATAGVWLVVSSRLGGGSAVKLTTQAGLPGSASAGQPLTFIDRVVYIWQVFLPPLPFMHRIYDGSGLVPAWTIYGKRMWGSFGWLTIDLPSIAYFAIAAAVLAAVALALRAALGERLAFAARRGEVAVLLVAVITVALSASYGLARNTVSTTILEQGRYLFPAATAGALLAVAACYGLGRERAPRAGALLVAGMMLFSGAAQLLVFARYFS
jgi:4-amino-4-deoxy-L-arabinose transferase-like glycosyltransferase